MGVSKVLLKIAKLTLKVFLELNREEMAIHEELANLRKSKYLMRIFKEFDAI